jgi:L,D-transpeptidase YcbB
MIRGPILRAAAALLLAVPFVAPAAARVVALAPVERAAVTVNVTDLLTNEPRLPLPVRQRADALVAYYQENGGPLLWVGNARMDDLVARLRAAAKDGLDPKSYPAEQLAKLADAAGKTDTRSRAIIELYFSAAFLEYASDLKVGRLLPHKVDPNFFLQNRSIDQLAALQQLGRAQDIDAFFDAWQPQAPDYAALKLALDDYHAIATTGGWSSVPLGDSLKPGMTDDARVPLLRARLFLTDGAPQHGSGTAGFYDQGLANAVKWFQKRHGLTDDGVVGKATVAALNVPVDERISEIVVAMERWRWMPENLGRDHLIVNIAGFDLRHVTDGRLVDRMAVVVGKPYSRTPVFSDRVRYLEFNPYWNVPSDIAIKEELPKLKTNPAARAAAGFEAVQGDKVYQLTEIDWSRYGPDNFPFQLRQRPGPTNALGRVKFMFPNQFNVYLHDTPSRGAFSAESRAFSHGCVRLSRPLDLAQEVLSGTPGWDRRRIDGVIAGGDRTTVNLAQPLPIHITYLTAWVDDGTPNFRSDIYEQDAKLISALDGRALAW